MFDSASQTPLIDIKGENFNLIHINLDNSESSTKESNLSRENSKCFDDSIEEQNAFKKPKKPTLIQIKNKEKVLNKKTKREIILGGSSKKSNKIKKGKYKIIFNLFNEFKSCSKFYKEYTQFHFIEKNIKNDLYSTPNQLAFEIRKIFSLIFATFSDSDKYNKTLIFCELFEKIYKKYENKTLTKKCKNLAEIINKLKRELRQAELNRNIIPEQKNNLFGKNNCFYSFSTQKNKFKLELNDSDKNIGKFTKKYKNEILNKIKKLNNEQKRGIFGIIPNNNIDKSTQNNAMEIDINKISFSQLKELDNYLDKCIKENYSIMSSPLEKKLDFSNNKLFEDDHDCDILKNDDLSSCLSDDEDEEDD